MYRNLVAAYFSYVAMATVPLKFMEHILNLNKLILM
jgi:hypothetical protein